MAEETITDKAHLRRIIEGVANGDGYTAQIGGVLIVKCDDTGRTDLHDLIATAWDQGYAVAYDDVVHSEICGTKCQCSGNYGQKNPYKEST